MKVNQFQISSNNAVKDHKKMLKKEEKVIKKLRKAEKKAFHMKTVNESHDSFFEEDRELEKRIRKVNCGRLQTYDHRWTPILQNVPLNFFSNGPREEMNGKFRNYLHLNKEDIRIARSTHSLAHAKHINVDQEIMHVKVNEFE